MKQSNPHSECPLPSSGFILQSCLAELSFSVWNENVEFFYCYIVGGGVKYLSSRNVQAHLKCIYQDVYKLRPYITQLHLSSRSEQIKSNTNLPGLKTMQLHDATSWLQSSKTLDEKGNFHESIPLMVS